MASFLSVLRVGVYMGFWRVKTVGTGIAFCLAQQYQRELGNWNRTLGSVPG